jgi:hypothetical protein
VTFEPDHGLWSTEPFDSAEGFSGTDLNLQTVTGGFAALIPQVSSSASSFHPWAVVTGWTVDNNLNTTTVVETDFSVSGGYVNAGDTALPSGYQRPSFGGGAWEVFTPAITGNAGVFSGQTYEYISMWSGSPDRAFFSGTTGEHYGNRPFTLEFDVASTTRLDADAIQTIPSGHLTGLPALTGIVNHGLYISDGTNWDYLEVRPDGIRSFNHPELFLPVSLSQPKRFRVGLDNTDLYIMSEDGKGVAGVGQFDSAVTIATIDPILAFGAPRTGNIFSFASNTVGFVGHSYWDNIKMLTGELILETPTGLAKDTYTTTQQSLWTAAFDAGVGLEKWLSAEVKYTYHPGGVTTVTPEIYTDTNDTGSFVAISSAAITLTGGQSPVKMDLTNVSGSTATSILNDIDNDARQKTLTSRIRFRIDQQSTAGTGPASVVDSIFVQGSREPAILDTVPDWKPVNREMDVNLYIKTEKFLTNPPQPRARSTFFYRAQTGLGSTTLDFTELSVNKLTGSVVGTGQIVPGPYDTAFQTYAFGSGVAISGSPAEKEFGRGLLTNYVPDPLFEGAFQNVLALSGIENTSAATGLFGQIGAHLDVPTTYTGQAIIELSKHQVHRAGQSLDEDDFAQKVEMKTTAPDDACGVEVIIPEGITEVGRKAVFSFSLKVNQGSGVTVYGTGSTDAPNRDFLIDYYSGDYRPVSVPVDMLTTGEGRLGIISMSGSKSTYIIDDLSLKPIDVGYLKTTDVLTHKTPFGVLGTGYADYLDKPPANALRACTVASCDLMLDIYPTGTNNVLLQKLGSADRRGFTLNLNTAGYPICTYDVSHSAFFTGINPFFGQPTSDFTLKSRTLTGQKRVPLGKWTNVGFIHQSHANRQRGGKSTDGQVDPQALALSNMAYLVVDGLPVAAQDTMTEWIDKTFTGMASVENELANPFPSFVSDATGTVVVGSGIYGKVENVHINRPPSADAEHALYIDAARVGVPYFVPDVMLKPGHAEQDFSGVNAVSDTTTTDDLSPGTYALSVYNLYNPGPVTNWDHGAARNHLIFFNDTVKETGTSPYSGIFGSTRFKSGAYGKAGYSSAVDRLSNFSGAWTGLNPATPTQGRLIAGGWIYPRETGTFFEIITDDTRLGAQAIALDVPTTSGFRFRKVGDSVDIFTATKNFDPAYSVLNKWNHVGFDYKYNGISGTTPTVAEVVLFVSGATGASYDAAGESDAGFAYRGNNQDTETSAMFLGRLMDCNMADVFLDVDPGATVVNPVDWPGAANTTGSKGGLYQRVYYDGTGFTGSVSYESYGKAVVSLPKSTIPKETKLWAGVNEYITDEADHLEGFALYDSTPFIEAEAYAFQYDDAMLVQAFGATDSPIRMGFNVPRGAIGLARIDTPEFSVPNTITSIDLSDRNPNNLSTFREGEFSLFNATGAALIMTTSGNYEGINAGYHTNQFDMVFTEQVDTRDIRVTSLSVADRELDSPNEAYYAYLIGRGNWGVTISDAFPHNVGDITQFSTGTPVDRYISNLEKVRKRIDVRTTKGTPVEDFSWDLVTSPFTYRDLASAVRDGEDIAVDGVVTGSYSGEFTGALPAGVFSVLMISPVLPNNGETVWVHYPGYNLDDGHLDTSRREIYNPTPVMRQKLDHEVAMAGQFSLELDSRNQKHFDVRVYGVNSGYSGSLLL